MYLAIRFICPFFYTFLQHSIKTISGTIFNFSTVTVRKDRLLPQPIQSDFICYGNDFFIRPSVEWLVNFPKSRMLFQNSLSNPVIINTLYRISIISYKSRMPYLFSPLFQYRHDFYNLFSSILIFINKNIWVFINDDLLKTWILHHHFLTVFKQCVVAYSHSV